MAFATRIIARHLSTSSVIQGPIKNVTVIGGGLMGSGIAQVAAQTGHQVTLVDTSNEILQKSKGNIQQSIARVAKKKFAADAAAGEKFIKDALSKITLETNPEKAAATTDLVIEAIVEKIDIKQELFKRLDKVAPKHTIFATNTSSLSVADIAKTSERKDRFGGLHFFNPVPVMKLLEVIYIKETSDETFKTMMEFGKNMGKECVRCKDTPGFIVNALLGPYMNNALAMYERGDATYKDIDTAMKLGAGYPMGPFELMDYTGLDLALSIREARHKLFPNNPELRVPEILRKLVSEGKYGRKSGEGFYKYK
jgi:3-hydroxyacyl-CoA dehydrogenase